MVGKEHGREKGKEGEGDLYEIGRREKEGRKGGSGVMQISLLSISRTFYTGLATYPASSYKAIQSPIRLMAAILFTRPLSVA